MKRINAAAVCAVLASITTYAAAQTPEPGCGATGLYLQVLGSGGPDVAPGRASSGYLIWLDGRPRVLVDVGAGTALRLAESGARVSDLDLVLLTHLHVDHTADFPTLVSSALLEQRTRGLRIYGPAGNRFAPSTVTFVRTLFDSTRGAWRYLGDVVSPLGREGLRLEPHDIRTRARTIGGRRDDNEGVVELQGTAPLQVAAATVIHGVYPALAWRVKANGKAVVFSGDMNGEGEALARLAHGADLFVAHHAVAEGASGIDRYLHMPPSVIGAIAERAAVKHLILAHRTRATLGQEDQSLGFIRKRYAGPITFADDLACFSP